MKTKFIILFVVILLVIPVVFGAVARCGDGLCDRRENCGICPSDCLKENQVCCNSLTYNGDCCSDKDCGGSSICVSHNCRSTTETDSSAVVSDINWEMIGVLIVVGVGIVGFLLSRIKRGKTSKYMKEKDSIYDEYKFNTSTCESELNKMEREIEEEFNKGKLTEANYNVLTRRIERHISDIRKGIISSSEMTPAFKKEISEALEDGRISKTEYSKLAKMKLKGLTKQEKVNVKKMIKKWREEDKARRKGQ